MGDTRKENSHVPKNSKKVGGIKADEKKLRIDLISPFAIIAMAAALTYGEMKYFARNWELGMEYGRLFGAALRHLFQWWLRHDKDEEQGLSHLGAVMFSVQCLIHYEITKVGIDDRPNYGKLPEELTDMLYHGNIPEKVKIKTPDDASRSG